MPAVVRLAWAATSLYPGGPMPNLFIAILLGFAAMISAVEAIPAFTTGCRILFIGDSITDGGRIRGKQDLNHILGHSYVYIIAARHGAAFPEAKLDFVNRGIGGNTILDLEQRWQADVLDLKPDILSILIGANDTGKGVPPEQYEQVYDRLIGAARATNPKLRLVLGEPFRRVPGGGPQREPTLAMQAAVARLAAKHGAALVRYQRMFDEAAKRAPLPYWIWDDVHPTFSGHQLMADAWEQAVRGMWAK